MFKAIIHSIFVFWCSCIYTYAQEKDVSIEKEHYQKTYLGMQVAGPSLVSFHFEHTLLSKYENFSLLVDAGIGLSTYSSNDAEYPAPQTEPNDPATYVLHLGFPVQYNMKCVALITSIHPSFYKYGNFGFININSMFGVRINFSKYKYTDGPFLTLAYTPELYTSLTSNNNTYSHFPFALRFGSSF